MKLLLRTQAHRPQDKDKFWNWTCVASNLTPFPRQHYLFSLTKILRLSRHCSITHGLGEGSQVYDRQICQVFIHLTFNDYLGIHNEELMGFIVARIVVVFVKNIITR